MREDPLKHSREKLEAWTEEREKALAARPGVQWRRLEQRVGQMLKDMHARGVKLPAEAQTPIVKPDFSTPAAELSMGPRKPARPVLIPEPEMGERGWTRIDLSIDRGSK